MFVVIPFRDILSSVGRANKSNINKASKNSLCSAFMYITHS